jgi:DNA-binding response OmpR family regulator
MGDVFPRIVIIDDDPAFLATVRLLLEAEGFVVAGEALNGLDGVAAATDLAPDIVLVDVNLPDIDGFEVVERLTREEDAPPVVLTSIRSAHDFGNLVERSRARGFITKADITGEALTGFLEGRATPA